MIPDPAFAVVAISAGLSLIVSNIIGRRQAWLFDDLSDAAEGSFVGIAVAAGAIVVALVYMGTK